MKSIHQNHRAGEEQLFDLDEIARQGARMLAEALKAEVDAYIEAARGQRDEEGRALVFRNGHAREREILLEAGKVEIKAPRVNDRRVDDKGHRRRFKSVILPPYVRRSPKITEVLPLFYLHGLSSTDFVPALEEFFGSDAGLSTKHLIVEVQERSSVATGSKLAIHQLRSNKNVTGANHGSKIMLVRPTITGAVSFRKNGSEKRA